MTRYLSSMRSLTCLFAAGLGLLLAVAVDAALEAWRWLRGEA